MVELEPRVRNHAAAWSDFDAEEYWKFNFATVLPEDAQIIRTASKFLTKACKAIHDEFGIDHSTLQVDLEEAPHPCKLSADEAV